MIKMNRKHIINALLITKEIYHFKGFLNDKKICLNNEKFEVHIFFKGMNVN